MAAVGMIEQLVTSNGSEPLTELYLLGDILNQINSTEITNQEQFIEVYAIVILYAGYRYLSPVIIQKICKPNLKLVN